MTSTPQPPIVRSRLPGVDLLRWQRDPLRHLTRLARRGDVVRFYIGPRPVVLISDPELIRDVLVTQDRKFTKGPGLRVAERLLGKGLLTSEGDLHRRQRRLAQPAFHRHRISAYTRVMLEKVASLDAEWRDGMELDIVPAMQHLTLAIAGATLFGADVTAQAEEITGALSRSLALYNLAMLPFAAELERFFPMLTRRFDRTRQRLDQTIHALIARRRADTDGRDDLLSLLLSARDEEGDGAGMTDALVRDEVMTLILAGYETTANALAWTWYLLGSHPDVLARLHAELDTVLKGRRVEPEDLPNLVYTRQVLMEVLRLFPPAWTVARTPIEDVILGGFRIVAGTTILMSEWVVHRDPRWYAEPERFHPDRWAPDATIERPRFAYFPFGGGSRLCIGEQFAWSEALLVIATIAQRWTLRLGGGPVQPRAMLTLRPCGPVTVTLLRRAPADSLS